MRAKVETTIVQWIDVPEGTDKQDILNFLAANESFTDLLVGISDTNQEFRIVDTEVVYETVLEIGEEAYDD
jgi:hypothetical protein